MATSLLRHETIRTTVPKAKELRRVVEPLITLAKVDSAAKRRLAFSRLRDVAVVEKLFDDLGPRFKARAGGYTRILKMEPRPGDSADMALMQLVEALATAAEKPADADKGKRAKKTKKSAELCLFGERRRRAQAPQGQGRRGLIWETRGLRYPANRANASRVMFSGAAAVATTLSSIRMPPYGRSSSTTVQSMCARRLSSRAALSSESIQ